MTQNPIRKVLSTLSTHGVRFLLMGGQACIFYGAAEFSRDTDIALLAEPDNLARLQEALTALGADRIALPPFELPYLLKGHAVHFRCGREDVAGMRLDAMARMRGVEAFPALWERRTTATTPDGETADLLALPDLVRAKKTQRDKDWPMVRRLVEAHYARYQAEPTAAHVEFWLREGRTSSLLVDLAERFRGQAARLSPERPLLAHAVAGEESATEAALEEESRLERARDREYWSPLIRELEEMRHAEARRKHDERGREP